MMWQLVGAEALWIYGPNCSCPDCKKKKKTACATYSSQIRLCHYRGIWFLVFYEDGGQYGTVDIKKQQKEGVFSATVWWVAGWRGYPFVLTSRCELPPTPDSPGQIRQQDRLVGAHSDPTTFCRATAGTSSSDFFFSYAPKMLCNTRIEFVDSN